MGRRYFKVREIAAEGCVHVERVDTAKKSSPRLSSLMCIASIASVS
jgi:hypothetical protein